MNDDALAQPAPAVREAAATRPASTSWSSLSANLVVGLALAGSAVCVPLLASANARLRTEAARRGNDAATLTVTLNRNVQLSALAGRRLPASLATPLAKVIGPGMPRHPRGAVVMTYTSMACTRSMSDGFRSLRDTAALLERGIGVYALLGQRSPGEREKALLMRADGELPFNFATASLVDVTAALFPTGADSTFDEEPLYVWLAPDLTIRSVFHGDQRRPALLDAWLAGLR